MRENRLTFCTLSSYKIWWRSALANLLKEKEKKIGWCGTLRDELSLSRQFKLSSNEDKQMKKKIPKWSNLNPLCKEDNTKMKQK